MQDFLVHAIEHHPQQIKCSLSDHFVFRAPVSVAFFYRQKIPPELIISSLQHTLKDFPVFGGILSEREGQLYIDCNNQGVSVSIIEHDSSLFQKMQNFQKTSPDTFVNLFDPAKCVKKRLPLLTIKLSYYKDGMVIGYCWHHSVGDISTFMEFVRALSTHAKGSLYPVPVILQDRENYDKLHVKNLRKTRIGETSLKVLSLKDIAQFIWGLCSSKKGLYLYFTQDELAELKKDLSEQTGLQLSRNDALCGHLLHVLASCRDDISRVHHASIIINYRKHLNIPSNVLGNYIDAIPIKSSFPHEAAVIASSINQKVQNYLQDQFDPNYAEEFVAKNGGIKNVKWIIPTELLPQYKNLIFSNWCNQEVYSIDFGIEKPFLFLPVGRFPISWVACIYEGFENKGLIVAIVLPSKVGEKLMSEKMLKELHQYRHMISREDAALLNNNPWCY